ncbi:ATP-dependent RNA helicase [Mycoemilia scoparia]|uniref:ATP-dependent RNA helicase n=1 Tax=Mycoemilia scoparia TaxID=417184 RepID=A0A9W7ZRV8_9FUNG|nr:ATP-dependent RNA helicase [Mycoemilia scoparia]
MWTVKDKPNSAPKTGRQAKTALSNKRRKGKKVGPKVDTTKSEPKTADEEWNEISNANPPPLPEKENESSHQGKSANKRHIQGSQTSGSQKRQKTNDRNKNNKGKNKKAKVQIKKSGSDNNSNTKTENSSANEDAEVFARDLLWKSVRVPEVVTTGDDEMGGFIGLEEISDVEGEWIEDKETNGRINTTNGKNKKGKKGKNDEEAQIDFMDNIDWDDFIPIDTFSEEKVEAGELKTIKEIMNEVDAEDESELSDEDVVEQESVDDASESEQITEEQSKLSASDSEKESGHQDIDAPEWENLGVHKLLLKGLKNLGFLSPTEIQAKSLPSALSGRDIIGAAETGSGKTLGFGLPILQSLLKDATNTKGSIKSSDDLVGLILAPTRELALQVKDHISKVAKFLPAKIMAIVGGMSLQKQERLIKQHPNIIIGTPGRLWELFSSTDEYMEQLKNIKFLVLDEADRMLERGHFKELKDIFKAVNEPSSEPKKRQTFVFSATLCKDLNFRERRVFKKNGNKVKPGSMEELLSEIKFQDESPKLIDVTTNEGVSRTLTEMRLDTLTEEKDFYLYYLLARYPSRTLVFMNSIEAIKRTVPILRLLGVNVFGLHAQLQQRQRLKNVDRFKDSPNAVLVASDVAARGLDIPEVDCVIHYHLPRSGDIYVHRSGRTARAQKDGVSILFVAPEERKTYFGICKVLGKSQVPEFPVELNMMGKIRDRVNLARQIDKEEHKVRKESFEKSWKEKSAEELGIELDSDFLSSDDSENDEAAERKETKIAIQKMKHKLNGLLNQPILPRGISARYLAGGNMSEVIGLLNDSTRHNPLMPTLTSESAIATAKRVAKK